MEFFFLIYKISKFSTIYIHIYQDISPLKDIHTNLHILSNDKSLDPWKILGVSPPKTLQFEQV